MVGKDSFPEPISVTGDANLHWPPYKRNLIFRVKFSFRLVNLFLPLMFLSMAGFLRAPKDRISFQDSFAFRSFHKFFPSYYLSIPSLYDRSNKKN